MHKRGDEICDCEKKIQKKLKNEKTRANRALAVDIIDQQDVL